MKLRFFAVAVLLAVSGLTAHAQVGLYFNPVVSRISNSTADSGPFAFLGQNGTSQIFGGVDFGVYYEALHFAKVDVSLDIRDTIQHGNSSSINSFVVGPLIEAKPMAYSLKPYVEIAFGDGRTRPALSTVHANKLEVVGAVGVDRPLSKHVDWRILEIGYGEVTTISSQSYGGPTPIPEAKLLNFSTGLVFRFR